VWLLVAVVVIGDMSFSMVKLKRKVLKFGMMCFKNSTNKNRRKKSPVFCIFVVKTRERADFFVN
jgi:hypothetical protein